MICIHDDHRVRSRGEQTCGNIRDGLVDVADWKCALPNQVMEEHSRQVAALSCCLVVRCDTALRSHISSSVRILEHEGLEVVARKRVDDDVAFGARGVKTGRRIVVALDAEHVAIAPDVAQLRTCRRVVPHRDRALLNDEHLVPVGLSLPQDVFVGLVKPHPAAAGKRKQVFVFDVIERRVLFQEIGNAMTDDSCIHDSMLLETATRIVGDWPYGAFAVDYVQVKYTAKSAAAAYIIGCTSPGRPRSSLMPTYAMKPYPIP